MTPGFTIGFHVLDTLGGTKHFFSLLLAAFGLPFCGVLSQSVICHKKEDHGVELGHLPSRPVVTAAYRPGTWQFSPELPIWTNFAEGQLIEQDEVLLLSPVLFSEVIYLFIYFYSEKTFSLVYHMPRAADCWVCVWRQ